MVTYQQKPNQENRVKMPVEPVPQFVRVNWSHKDFFILLT
jgi:hypothetical protein